MVINKIQQSKKGDIQVCQTYSKYHRLYINLFPGGLDSKNLPAMQETWVQSMGWENPLEKEMATHSSVPAWRIPWTEEPGCLQCKGLQRVGHV